MTVIHKNLLFAMLTLVLISFLTSGAFATILFSDNFNRANSSSMGSDWNNSSNTGINSNTAFMDDSSNCAGCIIQRNIHPDTNRILFHLTISSGSTSNPVIIVNSSSGGVLTGGGCGLTDSEIRIDKNATTAVLYCNGVLQNQVSQVMTAIYIRPNGTGDNSYIRIDDYNESGNLSPQASANFSYTINKDTNQVNLKDTSTLSGSVKINYWTWKLGDTNIAYTQDYNYTTTQRTDLNICLRVDTNVNNSSTKCTQFNTGDWEAPTTTFTATQYTNSIINKMSFACTDNNSGCKWLTYNLDSNVWITVTNTGTKDINVSKIGNHSVQFYSTDNSDNNESIKTETFTTVGDTNYPVVIYTLNQQNGFSSDLNAPFSLTCIDNWLDDINYSVYVDGNIVWTKLDVNGVKNDSNYLMQAGRKSTFTFACTDSSGNTTTTTAPSIYVFTFRLVNEATGAQLTQTDVNREFATIRAYTIDGNSNKDFNTIAGSSVATYIGTAKTIYFELNYRDTGLTKINRQVNADYTDGDLNVPVCAPFLQTFYPQRFVATSPKGIVLKNNVSGCYVVADNLSYVYDTGYALTTYTIAKPYYLYSWSTGAKVFLAFVDGLVATQYNIDAIELSRSNFNLAVGKDTVAFEPLLNPITHAYDTNTLQIYYKSYLGTNVRTVYTIMNGTQTLWTTSDTNSPNEALINFLYTGYNITDENVLKLIVTSFYADATSNQVSYYFTINGASYLNKVDNSWAVIVAILFFLFGITLVAYGRIFGFFGILVCLISIGLSSYATNAWWVSLIQAGFFIIMIYIILSGKQNATGGSII